MRGLLLLTAFISVVPLSADAATVLCVRNRDSSIRFRQDRCQRGETRITRQAQLLGPAGAAGNDGAAGAPGPAGEDGQRRIYGDGSAGDLVVSGVQVLFQDILTNGNTQLQSLSVPLGATLNVPTGTVLRVAGDVTIDGVVNVQSGILGGTRESFSGQEAGNEGALAMTSPSAGISLRQPSLGELGSNTADRYGGSGGIGIGVLAARSIYLPGPFGGGGGAGGRPVVAVGGAGGGTLVILAGGTITINNSSTISANGVLGTVSCGGGGGGVIVLASRTGILSAGSLNARGGGGGAASIAGGSGGGGGGGLIRLIAPTITNTGPNSVVGGGSGGGAVGGTVTNNPRIGGGGGGASIGSGGFGGDVSPAGAVSAATSGGVGLVLETQADPTALF